MLIARILEGSGSAASNASEYSWCILEGHSAAHSQYFIFLFSSLPSSFHYSFPSFFLSSTFICSFYLPSLICCPPSSLPFFRLNTSAPRCVISYLCIFFSSHFILLHLSLFFSTSQLSATFFCDCIFPFLPVFFFSFLIFLHP